MIPFEKEHMTPFLEMSGLAYVKQYMTKERIESMEASGTSFTVINAAGRILAIAGVTELWRGVGEAWALFAPDIRKYFLHIHRAVKTYLDHCPFRRVQMTVDCNFRQGHRWANLLGFKMEAGVLEGYFPDGRDVSMYARVRA